MAEHSNHENIHDFGLECEKLGSTLNIDFLWPNTHSISHVYLITLLYEVTKS